MIVKTDMDKNQSKQTVYEGVIVGTLKSRTFWSRQPVEEFHDGENVHNTLNNTVRHQRMCPNETKELNLHNLAKVGQF